MKNIIFAILFFIFSGNRIYAHGEGVHQHMVREAYKLLKHFIGQDIREKKDHVGYNEQGNGQFNPGNLIVIGAYQEDHSDDTNEGYGIGGFMASNTHFWDPDQGDNSKFNILGNSYSNAYQKARKYIYGGYELRVPYENGIIEAYSAPSNLFQFYKDGQIYYKGYYDILGQFISRNRWNTASLEFRNKVVWEILGRICHLLGDMSIPAHTHNDPHYPDLDSYEEWMNQPSIYNQWTYQNAINQGGLINPTTNSNPLKYLFYSTSQITSFFPSDDVDGNNGSSINDPFTYYSGLNEFINNLNSQYINPPAHGDPITNNLMNAISNNSFVYGIRSISGLLYLFAKEADLLPQPLVSVSLFGDNTLYAGGIGHWSVSLQNGIEPFTYNWQIMYLNGIEYLQRDENLARENVNIDMIDSKDGGIIINAAPSNEWVPIGANSPYFSKPHNPNELRNFKLKCIVKDGSNTIKTSNEYYVEVVSTPPELPLFQKRDINEPTFPLAKEMEINSITNEFSLDQNYPNPFNPSTRISYFLPEANFVTLKVYDILGNEIVTIVSESKPSGKHEVEFNGSNLPSGTYIYKLTSGNYQTIRKMLLIK